MTVYHCDVTLDTTWQSEGAAKNVVEDMFGGPVETVKDGENVRCKFRLLTGLAQPAVMKMLVDTFGDDCVNRVEEL